ncbi:MAG: TIGR04190 family B12-binding domain/radical SAM domain protein [Candidatus Thermoplasmatota archaeon]|jgi:B12-binding domain/radical SAM domain protein|nr:TIGR04190 family B12-binding domain/radical SAM domain protein [Candidatus Thermoplasmatota archaeon]
MKYDLVLMHPPSIYDFRKRNIISGPISEVVPSTGVFEMYPIGFLSILSYLQERGHHVRIDNIALKMLNSKRYDFKEELLRLDTDYVGIDLHWLPHVHGAISLARIIKEYRPDIKVMMGGFSATYYASEIMDKVKDVDIVVKGDTTELPMEMIIEGKKMEEIPNITYRSDGKVMDNGFSFVPDLDYQSYNYSQIIRSAIRSMDFIGHLPYCNWTKEPVAMVLTVHGCSFNCAICGGSYFAYKNFYNRKGPVFRPAKRIVEDVMRINDDLKIPVFIVSDILMRPRKDVDFIFSNLKKEKLDIPLLFELFCPHSREHVEKIVNSSYDVSLEISPDSSSESIRLRNGRPYQNSALEKFVSDFLEKGGKKMDIYFMIGLSHQSREDAILDVKYAAKLMDQNSNDRRIFIFTSPVSPFLDPGSAGFENPELGFKLRYRTLMEHFDALDKGMTWEDFRNFETSWMDTINITETTYDSIDLLLLEKKNHGYIEDEEYRRSHSVLQASRLAVSLSRNGDHGMLSKGEALIKNCGSKYTILKKDIMFGNSEGKERRLIYMIYKYLHSSHE